MPQLNFAPGTREGYSDGNYMLLGLVVERVSGQPLGAYLQSTIFGPLGMTHTVLTGDHTVVVPHKAQPYLIDGSPPSWPIESTRWASAESSRQWRT